ncbi:MAG: Fic family protein [Deltaproteobacteria bacterium]|nr:Fic family protein [Deltaproteobacteria bacterium]
MRGTAEATSLAEKPTTQPPQAVPLEERIAHVRNLIRRIGDDEVLSSFRRRFDMSWIYHDNALEGVVFSGQELRAATDEQVVSDPALLPAFSEIRQHKTAIDLVREMATRKRLVVDLEVIKQIYAELAPEESEGRGPPKYRKDMPLHRLYFHEISPPDKIAYRMRQLMEWVNAPETKRSMHPIRLAAKTHHRILQIFPFPRHSGKVARLLMNLLLLRAGFPPAIIHSTERQRYYETLKSGGNQVATLVQEALESSIESAARYFEDALTASGPARITP